MHKNKEPLFHIVKRVDMPWYFSWCVRAAALVFALVCCGVISTIVTKDNPIQIFATIIDGSFGASRKFMVLLQNTAMLLCVALALTPAFKMRFWNIGGEGQFILGAIAAAFVAFKVGPVMPSAASGPTWAPSSPYTLYPLYLAGL